MLLRRSTENEWNISQNFTTARAITYTYLIIYMYVGMSTIVYGGPIQKICMLKCMGAIT